jgi:SPP1 gp7 family putative phage head morphogenesis protein
VIEERPGKSTVGKLIRSMNLGDFVTTTQALTGTELSTARLETVLRTNTNRATTEGAAEVLRDERVQAFVPLVQYSATKDPRTRPAHRAMDGYVGTIEDFDRMGLTPPCGFNCRCALIPVPAAMALDKGWTRPNGTLDYAAIKRHNGARQTVVDRGEIPDPGFVNA